MEAVAYPDTQRKNQKEKLRSYRLLLAYQGMKDLPCIMLKYKDPLISL